MAFAAKKRRAERQPQPVHEAKQETSLIARNVAIEGTLRGDGLVRLEADFQGRIEHQGHLVVAEGAVVKATIEGHEVTVFGTVEGDIAASAWVELKPTARIIGNIKSHRLTVADGASLIGSCNVAAEGRETEVEPAPEEGNGGSAAEPESQAAG